MGIMLIVLMAMLVIKFHQWPWQIALAVVLMFFAMMVLAGVVILVSTRVSTILAALVGVVTFALGVNMESLYNLARPEHVAGNMLNAIVLSVLAAVLPNLSMFDLRVQVASQVPSPWGLLWPLFGNGVLYAVGYLAVLLIAASLLFNEREV
jgi:ABC-type transport system involved in multi-copper enzyme maturation permease subunit